MKVLVTGATGFLGRRVVESLGARGHRVRALVRPASPAAGLDPGVEVARADLRGDDLGPALGGVDAVVHLAIGPTSDGEALLAETLVGTERLLAAMAGAGVRRLVLASSLVVYDWAQARGALTEETPLADDPYRRGGYDVAKRWQERLVADAAARGGWAVTVLRPGFIWGRGRASIAGMGRLVGRFHLLFGPFTRLPLTHVDNCADCFAVALRHGGAAGQAFNVVDGDGVRVWRYALEHARGTGTAPVPVAVPYAVGLGLARLARATSRRLHGSRGRLPSLLDPARFEAQFKPLRFPNRKLREVVGWSPPLAFAECLARTYGPDAAGDGGGAA